MEQVFGYMLILPMIFMVVVAVFSVMLIILDTAVRD